MSASAAALLLQPKYRLMLFGVLCLAAALRIFHLGYLPLWIDEALSEWYASQSLQALWADVPSYRNHPSTYWILLKGWTSVFGSSEAALRALSALFGVATVPVAFALGKEVGDSENAGLRALLCALLFSLSPLQIQYAQEARPYAALSFSSALALLGIVSILKYRDGWYPVRRSNVLAAVDRREESRLPLRAFAWALLGAGTVGVVALHTIGWLFVAGAIAVPATVLLATDRLRRPQLVQHAGVAVGFVALAYAPFAHTVLRQVRDVERSFWAEPVTWQSVWKTSQTVWGSGHGFTEVQTMVFVVLAAVGLLSATKAAEKRVAYTVAAAAVLPMLFSIAVSIFSRPVLVPRTLIFCNLPMLVLVARGTTSLSSRRLRVGLLALLGGLCVSGLQNYYTHFSKEPWHRVVAHVVRFGSPQDVVLFIPNYAMIPFSYYARRVPYYLTLKGLPEPFPAPGLHRSYPTGFGGAPMLSLDDTTTILDVVRDKDQVWVIANREDLYDPDSVVRKVLLGDFVLAESAFTGPYVLRFVRKVASRSEDRN